MGDDRSGVDDLAAVERWFVGRGIPHFIDEYAADTDIWNRAIPLLVLGYFAGGLNALDIRHHSAGWNVAVAALIVAILVATWALANRLRGHRAFAVPTAIGPVELAVFVLGPAIPSAILGQWRDALESMAEGLGVLALIYLVTSYGVIPMTTWAARRAAAQLASLVNLVVRVLPLLLLFMTFLFINAEVWQLAGTLTGPAYWATLGIFFVLGTVFVLSRVPGLIGRLATFDTWGEVRELLPGTPAECLACPTDGNPAEERITRRTRFNIGLVAVFSQALQITLVVVTLFLFFVLFGWLAIPLSTTSFWTTLPAEQIHVLWEVGGRPMVVTEPLLRVSGFLAAFSGMYLTVVLATDATYRDEVAEDVGPEVRQAFAVRAAYLHTIHARSDR